MKFALGCGGTGGHIFPALAIAEELHNRGHQICFIGNNDGMEARLIPSEGYNFNAIKAQKIHREFNLRLLSLPFRSLWSVITSMQILRKEDVDAVICTGGFVSGPVALASVLLRIPLYFHESNSYPGITTKLLTKYTRITFVSYPSSRNYMNPAKVSDAGVPLLQRTIHPPVIDIKSLGLSGIRPIILVTGGSQGSMAINKAVDTAAPELISMGYDILWQCGRSGIHELSQKYSSVPEVHVFDFTPNLTSYYRHASLAITRAGALTLAELEINRLPSILIPLPTAAENHQFHNALEQQKKGLALVLAQKDLNTSTLIEAICQMHAQIDKYQKALASLPANTASYDICEAILDNLQQIG